MKDGEGGSGRPIWSVETDDAALQHVQGLVNAVSEAIFQLDPQSRFVGANDAFVELADTGRDELVGEHASVAFDQPTVDRLERTLDDSPERTEDDTEAVDLEVALQRKDDTTVTCDVQARPFVADGQCRGLVCVVRDHSYDGDTTETERPDPREATATILDVAEVGVFLLDDDLDVAWVDETIEEYFDLEREHVLGRDKRELLETTIADRVADSDAFAEKVLSTYDDSSYLEHFECHVTPEEGRAERWLEHGSEPIESGPYEGGRIERYYDITDRKRADRAHSERSQLFESIVQAVEEYAIFMLDPDGRVATWNPGAERTKGYDREEILGEHFSTFYTPEDVGSGVPEQNLATAATEGAFEDEGWRLRKDGSRFWANVTITEIRDDEDSVVGYAKVMRDMTDRREQDRLRDREELLERYKQYTDDVLDAIDDVFYVVDEKGRLRRWNESLVEVSGYTEEEVASMHSLEAFDEADQQSVADAFGRGFETGSVQLQADVVTKDGTRLPYEFVASRFENPEGEPVLAGIGRDVSERETRECELERRAHQQQTVADIGQFALESDDLDELMDEAARRVAEALDTEYCNVLDLNEECDEVLLRQGAGWEDGTVGEGTVSATESDSQAAFTLAHDRPVVVEDHETETRFGCPMLPPDNDLQSTISTIIGPFDEPWGILSTHDTERRTFSEEDVNFVQAVANVLAEAIERHRYQAELERLVEDLEESNERLEQFAYAASHDLQEPLRMVSRYMQLLERRYADDLDDDAQEFIEFAVDGADRMRDMIDGLLQYSRVEAQGDPFEPVELDVLLEEVMDDLQVRIEETDAEIRAESLPRVEGDPSQLRQVFLNLLGNAIQYSGETPPQIDVAAERDGTEWVVSVHDEGIGIDPGNTDRVFEVFQRLHTQAEHDGTGIGLALCKRIVERHGGEIWVDSTPGVGTTFSLSLPAATDDDDETT